MSSFDRGVPASGMATTWRMTAAQAATAYRDLYRLQRAYSAAAEALARGDASPEVQERIRRYQQSLYKKINALQRRLSPVTQDLRRRGRWILAALRRAEEDPTPENLARARRALKEWDQYGHLIEMAGGGTPSTREAVRAARGRRVLTPYGARQEKRAERERQRRAEREAQHDRRAKHRDWIMQERKEREKHNRLLGEEKMRELGMETTRKGLIGRSLGLANAEGVGVAMLAYVMSLSEEDRAKFLATQNVVGFTEAAVQKYLAMVQDREKAQRQFLAGLRQQLGEEQSRAAELLERNRKACFPPPADLVQRSQESPQTPQGSGPAAPLPLPFFGSEVVRAARAVYNAAVRPGACAQGMRAADVYVAEQTGRLLQRWGASFGWVSLAPNPELPRHRAVFHLSSRVAAVYGDLGAGSVPRPGYAVPYDLDGVRTTYDRSGRTAPERPRLGSTSAVVQTRFGAPANRHAASARETAEADAASTHVPVAMRTAVQARGAEAQR